MPETALAPFTDLSRRLGTLDRRPTTARFDLSKDLPWTRMGEAGVYFPPALLRELLVDVDMLAATPGAPERFQWAAALATCEGFADTTQQILEQLGSDPLLRGHRSVQLLCEEKEKHLELFTRIAAELRDQRPGWILGYERAFLAAPRPRLAPVSGTPAEIQLGFWQAVVCFEELALFAHQRLAAGEEIQPLWMAAFRAVAAESTQHLVVSLAILEAVHAGPEVRARMKQRLVTSVVELGRIFGLDVAARVAADTFPGVRFAPGVGATHQHITGREPAFARTRVLLGLEKAATPPAPAPAPAPAARRSAREIEAWIIGGLAAALELPPSRIDPLGDLPEMSLDSFQAVELSGKLADWLGAPVPPTLLWDHSSVRSLASALAAGAP